MSNISLNETHRIDALITRLEKEGGSPGASREYLVLCCGWIRDQTTDAETIYRAPDGRTFQAYWAGEPLPPDPTTNAQDALDSLPHESDVCYGAPDVGDINWGRSSGGYIYAYCSLGSDGDGHGGFSASIKVEREDWDEADDFPIAAAICLARLRMELAKLEGG